MPSGIVPLQRGDIMTERSRAFAAVFTANYEPLCLYAARLTGDMHFAEDIVQDVFARFWKSMNSRPPSSIRPYLYAMTRNACVDYLRTQKYIRVDIDRHIEEFDCFFQPDSDSPSRVDKLLRAVNSLPEKARRVFLAIVVNDMKYKDVAAQMGISVNTVKTQLARSIALLRERLPGEILPVILLFSFFV